MKNKIFVFFLAALAAVCLTTCYNPIMEKWWAEEIPSYSWGKYTVSFDMVGGKYVDKLASHRSKPATQFIEAGKTAMDPGLAEKGSMAFGGWYTSRTGGKRWNFGSGGTPVNSDMTLYAHWGQNGHAVKFREINGQEVDTSKAVYRPVDEVIVHGERATEPLQFGSKEDQYSFEGWYRDTNFTDQWDFAQDTVTKNETLYVKWVNHSPPPPIPPQTPPENPPQQYTVKWDLMGSPDHEIADIRLTEGVKIPQPVAITNPGYAFAGWYTEEAFSRQWIFTDDTVSITHVNGPDNTITLYAKWTTPGMSGTGEGAGKKFRLGEGTAANGKAYPNTSPQPEVIIERNFFIDKYEVTNEKYRAVMGNVPSRGQGENMPLNRITWYDALEYCNKLSEREGLPQVYTMTNIERGKDGNISFIKSAKVSANFELNGYRLPTEAEWEYAARGGEDIVGTGRDYWYAGSNNPDEVAWYDKNSDFVPHPVGQKAPNYLGLYDMSGNLSEWCWDMYNSTIYGTYEGDTDPRNDDNSSKNPPERVRRGGNFNMLNVQVRARDNDNKSPTFSWPPAPADDSLQRYMTLGFRVVRTIPE